MQLNILRTGRVAASAAVLATLAACGSAGGGETESVVEEVDLTGVEISVGSKSFTEQEVLGQIAIEVLTAAGATVDDQTGLGSTAATRQALEAGAIDMYWEYTGTGWLIILGHKKPIPDPQRQYQAVAEEDLRKNQIAWVARAPANNTYAIAVRSEVSDPDSEEYDQELAAVKTLSDFGELLAQSPEKATLCVASEFANRSDGLPGLVKAYGWQLPPDNVTTVDQEDLLYPAIDNGSVCNFGEVFATDGRVQELDLRLLEDDQDFFAVYNPTVTLRQGLLDQYPEIEELFTPIAESLDDSTLRNLNTRVDVGGEPVDEVVRSYLEDEGFLTEQQLTR